MSPPRKRGPMDSRLRGNDKASRPNGLSELHRLPVAGELEVAGSHNVVAPESPHRPFPVDRPGARARVELLVVHQWLKAQVSDLHRNRIRDAGTGALPN